VEVLDGRHETINSRILVHIFSNFSAWKYFKHGNISCLENRLLDLSNALYDF